MPTQQEPYALAHDDGQALWFLGNVLTRVKATGEQTGGAYGLIDQVIPAGFASPWHVHHAEDETFYVLEGTITFLCGETRVVGGPGTFVYGPRGVPHGSLIDYLTDEHYVGLLHQLIEAQRPDSRRECALREHDE